MVLTQHKRLSNFSILRFIIVISILLIGFYGYVGLVDPRGRIYSSFLEKYFNFPAWVTYFISKTAKFLLEIFGYAVYQKAPNNVTIVGSRGVNILWACLGFGVMSFWVAFVVAHFATWQYKLKWCLLGIGLITVINILRIALIALALHLNWKVFVSIEPHRAFNIVTYIVIFGMVLYFSFKYSKR